MTSSCSVAIALVLLATGAPQAHGFPVSAATARDRAVRSTDSQYCCSFQNSICGDTTSYCKANQEQCEGCGGSWVSVAYSNKMEAYLTPDVCDADATAEETVANSCMDWNIGSVTMQAAAAAYGADNGLTGDAVPLFAVGTAGSDNSGEDNLGKCFKLTLDGIAQPMIVQAINTGSDVKDGSFDLQMAAGGEGAFTGCTAPAGGAAAVFGQVASSYPNSFGQSATSGGPSSKSDCSDLPSWPSADSKGSAGTEAHETTLVEQCEETFDLGLRTANPTISARYQIACPSQLVMVTGLRRTDDPTTAVDQSSQVYSGSSVVTRMMDCCKPTGGWVANIPNADPDYPAVMACTADGFTRMDGSHPPTFSGEFTGFSSWKSGKKCKHAAQEWSGSEVDNGTECQAKCQAYAQANTYTDTFCCAYKSNDNKCRVAPDGDTSSVSDERWKKANGQFAD